MSFWLYLFTEFASIPDEQIERLANWEIPPSKRSGNYQHSTLSKSKYWHLRLLLYTFEVLAFPDLHNSSQPHETCACL